MKWHGLALIGALMIWMLVRFLWSLRAAKRERDGSITSDIHLGEAEAFVVCVLLLAGLISIVYDLVSFLLKGSP